MTEEEQNYVDLVDEDGEVIKCEVYDVIDFEGKTYATLLPVNEENPEQESELIVLEYIENGEDGHFQDIEDEDEFNRVCDYIESLEYEDEIEE